MKSFFTILIILLTAGSGLAQINLKDKLHKKADQEIDNLLFGKKKNKNTSDPVSIPPTASSTANSSSAEAEEVYQPTSNSDPLGGYQRESVNYGSLTASDVVGFRDLINFLPDKFGSYKLSEKPDGGTMRYGEYRYSSGQKNYSDGHQTLRASIFDYLQTATFLSAYANNYEYESTDGIMKSVEVKGQPGWYSATYESQESSMMIVVHKRFMVSIEGSGLDEATLKEYMESLDIDQLPEAPPTEEQKD